MKRYENYSPEMPVQEELPPVESLDDKKSDSTAKPRAVRKKRSKEKRKSEPEKKAQVKSSGTRSVLEMITEFCTSTTTRLIVGLVLGSLGVYLTVACLSYFSQCVKDQSAISNAPIGMAEEIGNAAGEGGARLSEFLINESFGLGSLVIIVWLICLSLKLLIGRPKFKSVNFTIKCIVALITVSLIIGLLTLGFNSPVNWGGYHGRYVNEFLIHFLGWTGAVILCLLSLAIFIVICLRDVVNWVIRKKNEIMERRRIAAELKAERERTERELQAMRDREAQDAVKAGEGQSLSTDDNNEIPGDDIVTFSGNETELDSSIYAYEIEDEEDEVSPLDIKTEEDHTVDTYETEHTYVTEPSDSSEHSETSQISETSDPSDISYNPEISDAPSNTSEEDVMVVNVNTIAQSDYDKNSGSIAHLYKFPPAELLREGNNRISVDEAEQEANKKKIEDTLMYHGIPITNIEATVGPTVTLYEIRPDQGIKIAKIKNLADDIALSLAAIGVRIIAPIPGKGTVGIEVANDDPQTVSMRTIINSRKYAETKYKLPVALGSTIGNDVYIADLTKMPHLLVAGATGQGKSVGLNAIISSLLYKKRPDELKFVMIDPKEVEFSLYAKIEKHYLAKIPGDGDAIVTDMSKVVDTLSSLCIEMDNRYKLLRLAQVRNIEEYNTKIAEHKLDVKQGHRFLPYIVVVVDEFADLIMTSGKEVDTPIDRLAQKARAVGIHVIIATQRPSTNVITGIIKANFPVRIAFKVTSGVDSKTILDTTGAQQLIGRGDMLISSNSNLVRVQCAFIDTPEVEAICEYIERQPFNSGPYILPEPEAVATEGNGAPGSVGDWDPLLEDAAHYIVGSGIASTSSLQRHFSIGYARAGKIMDQMESLGIVGPATGGKPRDLRVDMYGLEQLLNSSRTE
ncbi:MAG: DNA translocase FtsK [Muribaculaceae bacterium]|nr:DNA translocase FtsK [Muribaculaceae bacterium]